MKKLNITKEQFNRSRYFQKKYGTLEYVSESGKVFKTDKGKVLMFKESLDYEDDLMRVVSNLKKDLLKSKWLERVYSPGPGVNEEIALITNDGMKYIITVTPDGIDNPMD